MKAKLVKGDHLNPATRRAVLARYVYRRLDTTSKSDDAWLKAHAFYVKRNGELDARYKHCEPHYLAD